MKKAIPCMGLGVYKAGEAVYDAVRFALDANCRHIDCAKIYGNEEAVGKAIRESGIPREEIFVTTKLWPTDFERPEEACKGSLRRLGLEYVDGYLLHWPGIDTRLRLKAYEALGRLREQGLIRVCGVSNFLIPHLEELALAQLPAPACDQLEVHPWYPQREVRAYCHSHTIQVICWAPLFRGAWREASFLDRIGQAHGKTPVQVLLRWHIQNGDCPIPKSVTPSRILENLQVFDFTLSPGEMAAIDTLEDGRHIGKNPFTYDGSL
ncbi:MAG: aldo/keto reductase [Clostridia bacterium]|nr:aldo/keto reductase [Candidatus Pelethousia sp.]NCB31203.1 aldo/keto reductase [Clostridia bacterium]